MAYLELDALKTYLGISGTTEDAILTDLLLAAQAAVDAYCDRTFAASSDSTRTFEAGRDTAGRVLYLDHDLAQVTSITNGDQAATTLAATDYVLEPRDPPYTLVRLRDDTLVAWEGDINLVGRWAYRIDAPAAVVQATREYAGYLYRTADVQMDRLKPQPDRPMPPHIQQVLAGYRRLR